jgi:hypothetical protein
LFITVCHEKLDLQVATLLGFAAAQLSFLVAVLLGSAGFSNCWLDKPFRRLLSSKALFNSFFKLLFF